VRANYHVTFSNTKEERMRIVIYHIPENSMGFVNVNCSSKTTTAGKLSSNSRTGDAGCSTRTTTAGKLSSNTGPGDADICSNSVVY
jgi:hypothetical protein